MNIILIILVFGVIIFFHELGHFIVAKINHISVIEFSMGLGPKLFSFTKKDTQYSLRLIPLGGYCMLLSEGEEGHEDDENAFEKKSIWVRMAEVLAGPFMNIVIAFIFSAVIIHFCGTDPATIGRVYDSEMAKESEYADVVKEFNGVYPAEQAGIDDGDTVLEIGGSKIKNFRELQIYLEIYGDGSPIDLKMQKKDGKVYDTTVYPVKTSAGYKVGIVRIEAEQRRLKKAEEENKEGGNDKRYGSFEARINDVILSCDDGKRTETLETGRKAVIEIDYSVETPVKEVHARYMIYRIDGQLCSGSSTKIDRLDAFDLEKDGKIVIEFDSMTLTRSQYWVDIVLEKADGTPIDYYKEAARFNVVSGIEDMGVARIEHTWKNC